jgi:hypothetical protein
VRWFRAVAERGFAIGQINLAFMYLDGLGVERDDAMAAALLTKAAERNHPVAQNNLGLLYAAGRGVPEDPPSLPQNGTRGRPARAWPMPSISWACCMSGAQACPMTMPPPPAGVRRRRGRGSSRRRPVSA